MQTCCPPASPAADAPLGIWRTMLRACCSAGRAMRKTTPRYCAHCRYSLTRRRRSRGAQLSIELPSSKKATQMGSCAARLCCIYTICIDIAHNTSAFLYALLSPLRKSHLLPCFFPRWCRYHAGIQGARAETEGVCTRCCRPRSCSCRRRAGALS